MCGSQWILTQTATKTKVLCAEWPARVECWDPFACSQWILHSNRDQAKVLAQSGRRELSAGIIGYAKWFCALSSLPLRLSSELRLRLKSSYQTEPKIGQTGPRRRKSEQSSPSQLQSLHQMKLRASAANPYSGGSLFRARHHLSVRSISNFNPRCRGTLKILRSVIAYSKSYSVSGLTGTSWEMLIESRREGTWKNYTQTSTAIVTRFGSDAHLCLRHRLHLPPKHRSR